MATRFDIDASDGWFIGEDKVLTFTDEDGTDMSSWSITYELKRSQFHSTALVTKTVGSGITIGDGAATNDRATVAIADSDTEDNVPSGGTYYHQLRRTDAGNEKILARGDAVILESGL